MGACTSVSEEASNEKARSKAIDSKMRRERIQKDQEIKLLLLGSGESGKSTIFKQMKIIHQNGYSDAELLEWKAHVHLNIVRAIQILIKQAREFEYDLGPAQVDVEEVEMLQEREPLTPEQGQLISKVWQLEAIQNTRQRASEFQLPDATPYFLGDVARFTEPSYRPTQQDVLHVRIKTTGIVETSWKMNEVFFKMFDVGGQRSERRKWIHCFDNVTAVIFVASLSEYDQVLGEDHTTNRMHEAVRLFEQICNSVYFSETAMILFLNKKDLLEEKIKVKDLSACFPEYNGGHDFEKASEFIQKEFVKRNRNEARQVYVHRTCATDTDNITFVFKAVNDIVIQLNLRSSGF